MAFLTRFFRKANNAPLLIQKPASSIIQATHNYEDEDDDDIHAPVPHASGYKRSSSTGDICRSSRMSRPKASIDEALRLSYGNLKLMHRGRHAKVFHARDRMTRQPFIVKSYLKSSLTASLQQQLEAELCLLERAHSVPGVAHLIEHVQDACFHYLVLEAVHGVTLIEHMAEEGGKLSESYVAAQIMRPLLKTVAQLHERGIVHRNLKPEHVMALPNGTIKLLDFASAADLGGGQLNMRVGTLQYMAPEVVKAPSAEEVFHEVLCNGVSEEELPCYDEKVDVWSVGVVAYELLTGCQPFLADQPADMVPVHQQLCASAQPGTSGLPLLQGCGLSSELCDFLSQALSLDPATRWSAAQLLQHPWLQSHTADACAAQQS